MYALGEKVKRDQKHTASKDEAEDREMDIRNYLRHGHEHEMEHQHAHDEEDAWGTEHEDPTNMTFEVQMGGLTAHMDARFYQLIEMMQ